MSRTELSTYAVAAVTRHLRRLGHRVAAHVLGGGHIAVDGRHVIVRVATAHAKTHRVTVGGKRYSYRYRVAEFNAHAHGRRSPRPAYWVLCIAGRLARDAFVIPGRRLGGKTYSVLVESKGRAAVAWQYRGAWAQLDAKARRAA